MSGSSPISESKVKRFFGTLGIFVFFGFLALILFQYAGSESLEDRAARGDFDEATTQARWDNLKLVKEAQAIDGKKIAAAMKTVAKADSKPAKTTIVVPGSPTFLKQMEAAAAPETAEPEAKPDGEAKAEVSKPQAEAKPAPAKPAPAKPAPAKPAPAKPATEAKAEVAKPKAPAKPAAEAKPEAKK